MYQKTVLENGLRVMTSLMPHARSVTAACYVGAGNRYENSDTAGLSHYLEHMLFKGSRRYPSARQLSATIESVGGALNASTDRELTVYHAKVPRAHLERPLDLLLDMLQAPLFKPDEFEKERKVILEELAMTEDSPADQVGQLLDAILFPDQPLGWDIAGTPQSVATISLEQAREYFGRQYVPNNVVVSVAGNVAHEEVVRRVETATGDWRPGSPGAWGPACGNRHGPVVKILPRQTEQAHLSLAVPGYPLEHPDRPALDLLSTLLGEGMSSRLFNEIREERALAYDVHSYVSYFRDTGVFGVYAGVDPANALPTLEAVTTELVKVRDQGVPEEELGKTRELARGRLELRMEDTRSVAGWVGGQELLLDRVWTPEELLACIQAVKPEDLSRIASELLRTENLHLAVVGPYRSERKFRSLLRV